MPNHIKPVAKNQKVKLICLRIDGKLVTEIDKTIKRLKITRTQFMADAARIYLELEDAK